MKLFVFSSINRTNIWAGIGAGRWAVSRNQAEMSGVRTKAAKMPIGAFGIIYCVESKSLTTPFVVRSHPDAEAVVGNIWPEKWMLPFRILPLGSPERELNVSELKKGMPSLLGSGKSWNRTLLVAPTTVFVPSVVTDSDWAYLVERLLP